MNINNNEKLGFTFCAKEKETTQEGDVLVVDVTLYKIKYKDGEIGWEDSNGLFTNDINLACVYMEGEFKLCNWCIYWFSFTEHKVVSGSVFSECFQWLSDVFKKEVVV